MKKIIYTLILTLIIFKGYSQCPECVATITPNIGIGGTLENPTDYTYGPGNAANGHIFGFNGNGVYLWSTNNTIRIQGIVVESGVHMILGTSNSNGNTEAFSLEGNSASDRGCITVKSGATLTLAWISNFKNVDVCVEDGGTIEFDSENHRNGERNTYTFENVVINLQGPNAILDFGDSFINEQGLDIVGWTGDTICETPTSPNPPGNESGNIRWNNSTVNICAILNSKVLPVEWSEIKVILNSINRTANIEWITLIERNNSHFVIQRSINNIDRFIDIGMENGSIYSDTPIQYYFIDENLPIGKSNIYYRIKQYDFDGNYSYSPVFLFRYDGINTNDLWIVYPNPIVNNNINIQLVNNSIYDGGDIILTIYSNNKVLKTTANIDTLNERLNSLVQNISNGISVLEINYKDSVEKIKLLKK